MVWDTIEQLSAGAAGIDACVSWGVGPCVDRIVNSLGLFLRDRFLCSLFCNRQGEKAVAGKILRCLSSRPALGRRRLDSLSCTFANLGRTLGPQALLLAHQPH